MQRNVSNTTIIDSHCHLQVMRGTHNISKQWIYRKIAHHSLYGETIRCVTFRRVHALLHGSSRLKHWGFKISYSRQHLLKTTAARHHTALRVRILRDLQLQSRTAIKLQLMWSKYLIQVHKEICNVINIKQFNISYTVRPVWLWKYLS